MIFTWLSKWVYNPMYSKINTPLISKYPLLQKFYHTMLLSKDGRLATYI